MRGPRPGRRRLGVGVRRLGWLSVLTEGRGRPGRHCLQFRRPAPASLPDPGFWRPGDARVPRRGFMNGWRFRDTGVIFLHSSAYASAIQGEWGVRRGPRSIPSPSPGWVPAPGLYGSGPAGLRPAAPLQSCGTHLSWCPAARPRAQVRFPAGGPRGLGTRAALVSEKPLRGVEQRQNHEPGYPSAAGCRASSKQDNR